MNTRRSYKYNISHLPYILFIFLSLATFSCKNDSDSAKSMELVADSLQYSTFRNLLNLTQHTIPEIVLSDSLAFLILPVQASCPACRKKSIDSIIKHNEDLKDRHYIIISAVGGYKSINAFFKEEGSVVPLIPNKLFLDSTNQAFKYNLYHNKPTMYYTYQQKAYKKISAIPATIKEDLREFFSGAPLQQEKE